jgi:hypothetical protein
MQSDEPGSFPSTPVHDAETGMDCGRIADVALSTWHDFASALSPIIGMRGVAALYKRSLHLTSPAYPWLETVREGVDAPVDFAPLKAALLQQTAADAAAASGALLQTFHDLLASLIGPSLTERLLRTASDNPSSAPAPQDTPP